MQHNWLLVQVHNCRQMFTIKIILPLNAEDNSKSPKYTNIMSGSGQKEKKEQKKEKNNDHWFNE